MSFYAWAQAAADVGRYIRQVTALKRFVEFTGLWLQSHSPPRSNGLVVVTAVLLDMRFHSIHSSSLPRARARPFAARLVLRYAPLPAESRGNTRLVADFGPLSRKHLFNGL